MARLRASSAREALPRSKAMKDTQLLIDLSGQGATMAAPVQ